MRDSLVLDSRLIVLSVFESDTVLRAHLPANYKQGSPHSCLANVDHVNICGIAAVAFPRWGQGSIDPPQIVATPKFSLTQIV